MPLFHKQDIRGLQLHRINLYRLFLQVLTLSDITTGYGTRIIMTAGTGNATQHGRLAINGPHRAHQTSRSGYSVEEP
jgi:hypothetical protein